MSQQTSLLTPSVQRSDSPFKNVTADIAQEGEIRSAAVQSRVPTIVSAAFVSVTMLSAFCIGLIFGWGPLAKILEGEGVYADHCAAGEPTPCAAQTVFYSLVYSLAVGALSFGGLPAGLLVDSAGPSRAALFAGSMIGSGLLLLALLPSSGAPEAFILPFMLMGGGGILTALTAFKSAAIFPQAGSMILTAVNVVFDISAIAPLLAYELYHRFGFTRLAIFGPYAFAVFALFAAWAALWRRLEHRLHAPLPPPSLEDEEGLTGAPAKSPESITPLDAPNLSLREVLWSKQFVVGLLWFNGHQVCPHPRPRPRSRPLPCSGGRSVRGMRPAARALSARSTRQGRSPGPWARAGARVTAVTLEYRRVLIWLAL